MIRFNATLTVTEFNPLDSNGNYQIVAQVADNTGQFYSGNLDVGSIIFMDGSQNGEPSLIKYVVTEIIDATNPPNITFNCLQTDPTGGPFDPAGPIAIIGDPDANGMIQIPDFGVQNYASSLYTRIMNYQADLASMAITTALSGSGGSGGTSNRVYSAAYTGTIDNTNSTYRLTQLFKSNTIEVFLNGLLQTQGIDYTVTGNSVIFTNPPQLDENGYNDELQFNIDPA
ncbi:hypothetical protein SBF1_8130002 [Candidatus Desulfosporosinus infrequens]|uniref:Uncharacterized protein n=1 Tax=Candidatus Desulfosporosinus infrequens TaxID=2043169 RepID=A0A2U3LTR7_9FIRM|nr:hypothetical protein SBF1_8130002 [Candidatus Desulfosporosinus infrequens]